MRIYANYFKGILRKDGCMFINRNGEIVGNEPLECNEELVKKYVVRLIANNGYKKEVIAEEQFDAEPNKNQIKWCLTKHSNADFAVVEEIYKLESELPF